MQCRPMSSAFVPDNSNHSNNDSRCQPFIVKLLSIVEDEGNRNLISWSTCGDFFRIFDCDEFARVVLPRYFRHCNWTSFVRQLNMYDFHKLNENGLDTDAWRATTSVYSTTTSSSGSSYSIKNADKSSMIWEFKHESFRRDATKNQLSQIKRKKPKDHATLHIQYADTMRVVEPSTVETTPVPSSSTATIAASNSSLPRSNAHGPSQERFDRLENQLAVLSSSFDGLIDDLAKLRSLVEMQNSTISKMTRFVEKMTGNGSSKRKNSPCTTTTDTRQQLYIAKDQDQAPHICGSVRVDTGESIKQGNCCSNSNNNNMLILKRDADLDNRNSMVGDVRLSKMKHCASSAEHPQSSSGGDGSSVLLKSSKSWFGEIDDSTSPLVHDDNPREKKRQHQEPTSSTLSSPSRGFSLEFILQQNRTDGH